MAELELLILYAWPGQVRPGIRQDVCELVSKQHYGVYPKGRQMLSCFNRCAQAWQQTGYLRQWSASWCLILI